MSTTAVSSRPPAAQDNSQPVSPLTPVKATPPSNLPRPQKAEDAVEWVLKRQAGRTQTQPQGLDAPFSKGVNIRNNAEAGGTNNIRNTK